MAELTSRSEDDEGSRQPPDALNGHLPENNEDGSPALAAGNEMLPNDEAFILADDSAEEFADEEIPRPASHSQSEPPIHENGSKTSSNDCVDSKPMCDMYNGESYTSSRNYIPRQDHYSAEMQLDMIETMDPMILEPFLL